MTILAVGVTDLIGLAQARLPVQTVRYVQLVWWVAVTVAAAFWIRPEGWVGAVAAFVAAAWYFIAERMNGPVEQSGQARSVPELFAWSAVGLVVILAGFTWLDIALLSAAVPAGLMWLALAILLTQTGNRLTRAILLLSGRELGADGQAAGAVPGSRLKGGRVIGPLERIFIMVLAVVGAYHVVAALMAAKGIVRFPEISADAKRDDPVQAGTKAEEFLVGSLASWGLAGGAALLASILL
ncbi:hypothetical protein [Enteractinococcus coprophilus]|nr:hypothetical protein [Enteractinococcus coprophilus]